MPRPGHPGTFRVGCSGYVYRSWRGDFYPDTLPASAWFDHYAAHFDTVEINNTFYRLPEASVFASWRERAPDGFEYAVKLSRFGTHMKKLKDPETWVGRFLERATELGPTLGPVLVQFPPGWKPAPERLQGFLDVAPRSVRWVIEMRERDWVREDVLGIMREHGAALCLHDLIRPHPIVLTADWTYLRFHGPHAGKKYTGRYTTAALQRHAARIRKWLADGVDVYAYFNNDAGGHAPWDALRLKRLVEDEPARATPAARSTRASRAGARAAPRRARSRRARPAR